MSSDPPRAVDGKRPERDGGLRTPRSKRWRGGYLLEALGIYIVLYPVFGWARSLVSQSASAALVNAEQIIRLEDRLGLDLELGLQQWAVSSSWFIGFWNIWYGSVHFLAPIIALVVLYRRDPARYLRWRNTYLWMLVPVLIGFWLFPLTPPRLLPASFGFVDTRFVFFTIGKPPAVEDMRFALSAMPSMHIAFATWTAFAVWPLVRRRAGKALLAAYPCLMVFATVVTANHYFLDALGGAVALAVGYALATLSERRSARRSTELAAGTPGSVDITDARPPHANVRAGGLG